MRARALLLSVGFSLLSIVAAGCSANGNDDDAETGDDANFTEGSNEARATLALVNMPSVNADELVREARITSAAAKNITSHRDGPDASPGTEDDDLFDTLAELDAIREVGSSTLAKLYDYAKRKGLAGGAEGAPKVDVVFSPQPTESSHLVRLAQEIDAAQSSIDIAIYSYSDANLTARLTAAVQRGVKVRFIYESGSADSRAANPAATTSARLENAGADVRYVNKIMHHKLLIVDGPRDDLSKAKTAHIVAGSANFSNSAATRYDENTIFMSNVPSLALKFQREFDLMWKHSKDFVAKPFTHDLSTALIEDSAIPQTNYDVFFSSKNFTVGSNGTTFTSSAANTVADALIDAIKNAQTSIHLASAHLRSRPVAEALLAKRQSSPDVDIRVYLDNQEYVSRTTHNEQVAALATCLERAGASESKRRDCTDKGFLFGYQLDQGQIDVRYKFYAYRWDHSYAPQMHHKYMIVDGKTLFSGSYNLSDNAEHGTFENMMVFRGDENAALVEKFEANFDKMWNTGRTNNLLDALLVRVETDATIPIVFDAMALSHGEITNLKYKIRMNCTAVDSTDFRQNAAGRTTCQR